MMRKAKWPDIVPCGARALTVMNSDFTQPLFTLCLCWQRKEVSQLMRTFESPSVVHFVSRVWWSTLSKALLKSTRSIRIMVLGESIARISTCEQARQVRVQWVFPLLARIVEG